MLVRKKLTNLEVAHLILRNIRSFYEVLRSKSLLNATQVSRNWLLICQSDNQPRRQSRHYLRRQEHRLYKGWFTSAAPKSNIKATTKSQIQELASKTPETQHNFDVAKMISSFQTGILVKKSYEPTVFLLIIKLVLEYK